jgi:hypothetical protein
MICQGSAHADDSSGNRQERFMKGHIVIYFRKAVQAMTYSDDHPLLKELLQVGVMDPFGTYVTGPGVSRVFLKYLQNPASGFIGHV